MSPAPFLKDSGIANEAGFVDIDKHTMRHTKYNNIWSLGDCSSAPNSKTAAAIFSQTMVLMKYFFIDLVIFFMWSIIHHQKSFLKNMMVTPVVHYLLVMAS